MSIEAPNDPILQSSGTQIHFFREMPMRASNPVVYDTQFLKNEVQGDEANGAESESVSELINANLL